MENKHVAFDADLCAQNPAAAADRVAELEEDCADLRKALKHVLASLVAATSILSRANEERKQPALVVASDKMFFMILQDYENAAEMGRKALS